MNREVNLEAGRLGNFLRDDWSRKKGGKGKGKRDGK
jgi:hypothetical protein